MTREVLRVCEFCGGTLLAADFIGRPVGLMDRSLATHGSAACSSERHAVEVMSSTLSALLDEADSVEPQADIVAQVRRLPWPDEQPPLVFCARHALNELGLRLLSSGLVTADQLERTSLGGLSAVHLAAKSDRSLPLLEALLRAGACPRARTQDGTARTDGGGRTALHVAAANGACLAVGILLEACPTLAAMEDWNECYPAQEAWLAGHAALALELATAAEAAAEAAEAEAAAKAVRVYGAALSDAEIEEGRQQLRAMLRSVRAADGACDAREVSVQRSLREMGYIERERERLSLAGRRRLQTAHLVKGLLSAAECEWLLGQVREAAALVGWQHARHKHYATEDVPLWRAPAAASWLLEKMTTHIGPAMAACFGIEPSALRLQECFGVRYEPNGQAQLAIHRDGTMFSFNLLLNDADSFEEGGTCFNTPTELITWPSVGEVMARRGESGGSADTTATMATLVRGDRGDCLFHCGQLLHGAASVTRGIRFILVGFVAEWWEAE